MGEREREREKEKTANVHTKKRVSESYAKL